MKAVAAVAEILKREGVEFLIGYPGQPDHRGGRRRPTSARSSCARSAPACTWPTRSAASPRASASASSPCSTGPAPRTPSAAWPRPTATPCRSWCCPAATRGASPTSRRTSTPSLNYRHVTKWVEQVIAGRRRARRDAPRLHPGAQRPPAPGAGRDSRRRLARGGAGAARLHAGAAHALGARSRRRWPRSRAALVAAERPVIYAGPGRALRAGLARSCASWPSCSRRRSPRASQGKSAFPENHPLSLGSGGRVDLRSRCTSSSTNADVIFGIGCSFTTTNYGVAMPKGKTHHPRDARPGRPQQGRARPSTALVGDAGLTLDALHRRGARPPQGQAARPRGRPSTSEIAQLKAEWLAQWMPKLTSSDDAAVALPRDLGPAAHGRRRQHHHHPRRGQPARPALAVLGVARRR